MLLQVLWTTFAVAWDLALLNWVSPQVEETIYLICDFTAKVSTHTWVGCMAGCTGQRPYGPPPPSSLPTRAVPSSAISAAQVGALVVFVYHRSCSAPR
jgi:hypothetical protein